MDKGMGCQLRFEGLKIKWIPDRLEIEQSWTRGDDSIEVKRKKNRMDYHLPQFSSRNSQLPSPISHPPSPIPHLPPSPPPRLPPSNLPTYLQYLQSTPKSEKLILRNTTHPPTSQEEP